MAELSNHHLDDNPIIGASNGTLHYEVYQEEGYFEFGFGRSIPSKEYITRMNSPADPKTDDPIAILTHHKDGEHCCNVIIPREVLMECVQRGWFVDERYKEN